MNAPVVIKVGGSVIDDLAHTPDLWRTLADVHASRSAGAGVIIVHGGGRAVDQQLHALGLETIKRDGVRITPPEHIHAVVSVLAGIVNTTIVAQLRTFDAPAVGLTLADADTVQTQIEDRLGPGMGLVGRVLAGDGQLFRTLLRAQYLPVVASIGSQNDGTLLNINADEAALGVAQSVHAESLVMLTDVPGVRNAENRIIHHIESEQIDQLISTGVVTGGMIAKLRSAADAADQVACPVIIGDASQLHDILTGSPGAGTRVDPARVRT